MESREWYAWINFMPPPPDDLHVVGEVFASNPGVEGFLTYRTPQGFNSAILLLDLQLVQRSGMWPQVMTWVPVRFDKILSPGITRYTNVQIFQGAEVIAEISVDEVR